MNLKAECLLAATEGLPDDAMLVEIGCVRYGHEFASEGWSTVYLAQAASEHGWQFHSVDRDPAAVANAQSATHGEAVTVHCSDGATWLSSLHRAIDFLYLDGSTDAPEALAQYLAARLRKQATVVIDDVQPIGAQQHGKGDALLDLLAADGFTVEINTTEPGYLMAVAKRC